jgi:hypothetical protein
MKKAGLIATSLGTAALLATGIGATVHFVTHPGDVVEEANAAEITPARASAPVATHPAPPPAVPRGAIQPAESGGSEWGVLSFVMGDRTRAERTPAQSVTRSPNASDDDDDDDGGDDD